MKFANLKSATLTGLQAHGDTLKREHINLGDAVRDYALDLLYERMGIEAVTLHTDNLATYTGESVILPINNYLNYPYGIGPFPLSHKIVPVFLSYAMHDMELCDPKYYLPYQPIGCRDEHTMRMLQSKGIQCYFSGCLSLTFDKRASAPEAGKVFFVDTPDKLDGFVPEEIKDRAVYLSHALPITAETQEELDAKIEALMLERLNMYKNEAALVVSSRVHCVAPCLAMGIPVIFVSGSERPVISPNGSFLDNLIPLYSASEYSNIDWHPSVVDIEPIKQAMITNAETSIREAYEKNHIRAELTDAFTVKRRYSVTYRKDFYLELFPNPIPLQDAGLFRGTCSEEDAYRSDVGDGLVRRPFANLFLMESIEKLAGRLLPQMRLIIFGAGNDGKVILYELKHLPRQFKSVLFIDNNQELHGSSVAGIPVFPVDYLRHTDLSETFILLSGSHHESMAAQLEEEYGLREKTHFWKSCRIISTRLHDFGYGPIMEVL